MEKYVKLVEESLEKTIHEGRSNPRMANLSKPDQKHFYKKVEKSLYKITDTLNRLDSVRVKESDLVFEKAMLSEGKKYTLIVAFKVKGTDEKIASLWELDIRDEEGGLTGPGLPLEFLMNDRIYALSQNVGVIHLPTHQYNPEKRRVINYLESNFGTSAPTEALYFIDS